MDKQFSSIVFILLLFSFVFPGILFSQQQDTPLPQTVAAILSNQFEGTISYDDLRAARKIQMKPALGEVTSFTFSTTFENKAVFYNVQSNNFNSAIIELINSGKLKRIVINNIEGVALREEVKLNPIVLEIGSESTNKIAYTFCVSTFLSNPNTTQINKKDTKMIQTLRGVYNNELFKVHSFTYTFYNRGEAVPKRISNPSALIELEKLIAKRRNGESILISNMVYSNGDKQMKGTPIILKITQ